MAIVLLVIGLLATAAGFVTIGFGIPINAFSLGNTLIVAGTITVATGLILIGLAAVIGQLRRIGEALAARPAATRQAVRVTEAAEAAVAQAAKAPAVAATRVVPHPVEAAPEPRLPEPAQPERAASAAPPGPLDWLRAKPKSQAAAPAAVSAPVPPAAPVVAAPTPVVPPPPEPPVVEDEAPLSPRPPQRPAPAEPTLDPKAWSPGRAPEPRPAPRVEQPLPRATPQVEAKKDDFDLVWPDRGAPGAPESRREEPVRREPERAPPPPRPARPAAPAPAARPAERGPAILKSGVIDGMPYTLYADGSIEAELSQGTVKFASVDALRAHLEKQS